jgi:hypothetical protein
MTSSSALLSEVLHHATINAQVHHALQTRNGHNNLYLKEVRTVLNSKKNDDYFITVFFLYMVNSEGLEKGDDISVGVVSNATTSAYTVYPPNFY